MAEILADNAAAVEELLALAREDLLGFPRLKIDGNPVDGVIDEIQFDEIVAAGGTGEGGGFTAVVRMSDFPDGLPEKFTPIEARGMALQILSLKRNISYAVLTAGDPVEEQ